ncbi:hypothetical protein DXG01_003059 [Tephrocybe rancida]|nr:hypothetical protein DXG01_003059 [Tephrocybe rancida]
MVSQKASRNPGLLADTIENVLNHRPAYKKFYSAFLFDREPPFEPKTVPVPLDFGIDEPLSMDDLDTSHWEKFYTCGPNVWDLSKGRVELNRDMSTGLALPHSIAIHYEEPDRAHDGLGNILVVKGDCSSSSRNVSSFEASDMEWVTAALKG